MKVHGMPLDSNALRQRIGNMDQVAGIKLVQLEDGPERPGRAALFHTGSGLRFMVYLDRGMDIPSAEYCGKAMGWRASVGDMAPQYYEAEGIRWLRNYFGGLLTTCGLQNVGAPAGDSAESGDGLHGRIGNTPARDIQVFQGWEGDDYVLRLRGTMRESRLFGENLTLTRTVWTKLGEERFWIEDTILNDGFQVSPVMLLYHCNIGWPAVEAGSQVACPSRQFAPRDDEARKDGNDWSKLDAPTHGYQERVFFHDMAPDDDGMVTAAVLNERLVAGENGFGVYVKYRKAELPRFTQWKMLGEQAYVVGLEPCNCGVQGRAQDEADGLLQHLEPGQTLHTSLEFGVVRDANDGGDLLRWQSESPSKGCASYRDFSGPGQSSAV